MNESRRQESPAPVPLRALNERLKTIVEDKTQGKPVQVCGSATDVTRTRGGHIHLRLRQGKHGLSCVVFRSVARELPFWIDDGQDLLVEGHVKVDAVWGELQLVAQRVELQVSKTQDDEFAALQERARAAGWLDPTRKRPLPRPPQKIGLVTGERSQARDDVLGSLEDEKIESRHIVESALMQGPGIVDEVTSALAALNAQDDVDVIVIARGGGSRDELDAFNDWSLAQAIVESRVPVITAIGHRPDQTLVDLVADLSVPTPSSVGRSLAPPPTLRQEIILALATAILIALLLILARALGLL